MYLESSRRLGVEGPGSMAGGQYPARRIEANDRSPREGAGPSAGNALSELALLRLPQVLTIIPISRSAWWQGIRSGKYPAPLKLGPRTSAWRLSDIRALLATFEPSRGGSK